MPAKLGRNDKAGMLPEGFLAGVSEDALGRRIPGGDAELDIPLHHRQRSVLEVNGELLLRLAHLFFCNFAVGDVAADAEQSDHLAIRVAIGSLG